jgi:hypothetical protein
MTKLIVAFRSFANAPKIANKNTWITDVGFPPHTINTGVLKDRFYYLSSQMCRTSCRGSNVKMTYRKTYRMRGLLQIPRI